MEYTDHNNSIVVHTQKNILSGKLQTEFMSEGNSVYDILTSKLIDISVLNLRVYVNDRQIKKESWKDYFPVKKDIIIVRVFPQGGTAEDPNKEIRTIAMIAVTAAAIYTGQWYLASGYYGGAFAAAAVSAGVNIGGSALVHSLVPIPEATAGSSATPGTAPTISRNYMIVGIQNRLDPFGTVPRVFGTHRIFPPLAAKPYTELRGDDYYLRMLFCLGYAPLEFEQEQIGETLVSEYVGWDSNYYIASDVESSARIYTQDIVEESINVILEESTYVTRSTELATQEISLDVYCPSLYSIDDKGELVYVTVGVTIEIKLTSGSSWVNIFTDSTIVDTYDVLSPGYIIDHTARVSGDSGEHKRYNVRIIPLTTNQYDIRIIKSSSVTSGNSNTVDDVYWSVLRSIRYQSPLGDDIDPNTALMEVEVKSSEQLTGVLDTYNLIVKNHCQVYDGISWSYEQTNNPAWAYTDVLIGNATSSPVATSRLDADVFKDWADWCDSKGFEFNGVVTSEVTVFGMLKQIAGIGRASPDLNNSGQYTIIQDVTKSIPVQVFTPRNSWNYSGSKDFAPRPNAYSITFNDESVGNDPNEVIVCNDDCSIDSSVGLPYPDKINSVSLTGATSIEQVWKQGRYYLSIGQLRPEVFSIQTDVEHLVCTRGDLVLLTYDVPYIGLGQARIKTITTDGSGYATSMTFDDVLIMEVGKTYGVYIRNRTSGMFSVAIDTVAGETTSFTFSTPVTTPFTVGDLFAFGETDRISADMIVKDITPGADLSATITMLDAAPDIHDADTGDIPAYDNHVTLPPDPDSVPPPPPVIDNVVSDGSILRINKSGDFISRILINFSTGNSGSTVIPKELETQFRVVGDNIVWNTDLANVSAQMGQVYISPVVDGETYELRIRFISYTGVFSTWVTHTETVIGKSQPIAPPTDFKSLVVDNLIELSWTASIAPDLASHSLKYDDKIPVNVTTDGLIGHWALNGTTEDYSGYGNDGVIEGTSTFVNVINSSFITTDLSFISANDSWTEGIPATGQITYVEGVFDKGCFFYGDDDRIDCGNDTPLDDIGTGSFTICFWMKSGDRINENSILFSKEQDEDNRIIARSNENDNCLYVELTKGGISVNHTFTGEVCPFTQEWGHVTIDVDRTLDVLTLFYRDDITQVFVTSTEINLSSLPSDISNTGFVSWGADDSGPNPYIGTIDESRIYNRSLEVEEVELLSKRWENYVPITINDTNKVQIPADWEGTKRFYLKAIDTSGNESEIVKSFFTIIKNKVTNLFLDVIDNNVQLKWNMVSGSLPVDVIEIRKGDVFSTAEVIGIKKGDFTFIQENLSGTYTYWVIPIDTAGNYGIETSATAVVNEPPDYILNVEWVLDFLNQVPSTITSTNVAYLGDGTAIAPANIAETFAQHFTNNSNTSFQDFIDDTYIYYIQPVPTTAAYQEESDYGTVLGASSISVALDKIDYEDGAGVTTYIAYKELSGDSWTEITGDKVFANVFRYVRDRFAFTSDGRDFSILNTHTIKLDTKEKTDAGNDSVTTASTGKVVSFNKTFSDIVSITVTPGGDGSASLTCIYDFVDIPNPTQFTVYVYDSTGSKTTGNFSWSARGF